MAAATDPRGQRTDSANASTDRAGLPCEKGVCVEGVDEMGQSEMRFKVLDSG